MPKLQFDFIANTSQLKSAFREVSTGFKNIEVQLGKLQALSANLKTVGTNLSKYVTLPLSALAGASIYAFTKVDEGLDAIRIGTGKTGKELEELNQIFGDIARTTPASLDEVAKAVADWNTRLGLSGTLLKEVAQMSVNLATMLKEDLGNVIEKTSQAINKWHVSISETPELLNHLFKVAQSTGIAISDLGDSLARNENVFSAFGMSVYEAASFIGLMHKNGIDTSRMLFTLRSLIGESEKNAEELAKAMKILTDETVDATTKQKVMEKILSNVSTTARVEFADALKLIANNLKPFNADLAKSSENINDVRKETWDFTESLITLRNQLILAVEPLGKDLAKAIEDLTPALQDAVKTMAGIIQKFAEMPPEVQKTIIVIGTFLALLGPALLAVSQLIPLIVGLGKAFAALGAAIASGALLKSLASFGTLLAGLLNPITALVAVASVIIGKSIFDIVKHFKEAKKAQEEFRESAETPITIQLFDKSLQKKWREAIKNTEKTSDAFEKMSKNISYSATKMNVALQTNIEDTTKRVVDESINKISKLTTIVPAKINEMITTLTVDLAEQEFDISQIIDVSNLDKKQKEIISSAFELVENLKKEFNKLAGIEEPFDNTTKNLVQDLDNIEQNINETFGTEVQNALAVATGNFQDFSENAKESFSDFIGFTEQEFQEGFSNVEDTIIDTTDNAVDTSTKNLNNLEKEFDKSSKNIQKSVGEMQETIGISIDSSVADFEGFARKFEEASDVSMDESSEIQFALEQIIDKIDKDFIPTYELLQGAVASVMTDVSYQTETELDKSRQKWEEFKQNVSKVVNDFAVDFSDRMSNVVKSLLNTTVEFDNATGNIKVNLLDWQRTWAATSTAIGNSIGKALQDNIKFKDKINLLGTDIDNFGKIVSKTFGDVGDVVGQFFKDLATDSENAFSNLGQNIAKIFINFLTMIEQQVLATKAAAIAEAIAMAIPTAGASLAQIPAIVAQAAAALGVIEGAKAIVRSIAGFAEGGIVMQPTVAMIGEGGEPEAVIPISKLNEFINGKGANEIHLHVGTLVADDYSLQELAEKLSEMSGYRGYQFESRI